MRFISGRTNEKGELVGGPMYYIKEWSGKALALACVSVFRVWRADRVWNRKCDTGKYDHDSDQFGFAELSYCLRRMQVPTLNLIIGIVIAGLGRA